MKIEKIKKLTGGRYKIFLEKDSIIVYEDVILNNNILYHDEIDDESFYKMKDENIYYELLNSSIKYITKRLRSEKEIRDYLSKKTLDNYMIDNIINNLKEQGLINDKRFAQCYINDKLNLTNIGVKKIKYDLGNLGISDDIIEEINVEQNNDKLEKLIIKKINNNTKYSNYVLKSKIIQEMTSLGYDTDDIINICDINMKSDEEIYNREYSKLYDKLKDQYDGSELEYQIKHKLYNKGFKI